MIGTLNGNVYQFTTSGRWNCTNRFDNRGVNMNSIYAPDYFGFFFGSGRCLFSTCVMRREDYLDFWGSRMELPITIVDARKNLYNAQYTVRVYRKDVLLAEKVRERGGSEE